MEESASFGDVLQCSMVSSKDCKRQGNQISVWIFFAPFCGLLCKILNKHITLHCWVARSLQTLQLNPDKP
eukprot:4930449-Amphidinium_carterae.3